MIVVDSKEPKWLKEIADKVENIRVDIIVEGKKGKFVIERKTLRDLVNSVRKGYFWVQLSRLKEIERKYGHIPIVIVEGNIYARFRAKYQKLTLPQWVGIKRGIIDNGIYIYPSINKEETKMFIKGLDIKVNSEKSHFVRPIIVRKTNRTVDEEREDVLSAISGIGRARAKNLLKKFGSVRKVFGAGRKELEEIVSNNVIKHLKEVYEGEYGEGKSN